MTQVRRFVRRLVTLFRPSQAEDDLAREVRAHLQLAEDQFVASGMSTEDAHYAARRAFGGVEQAKEQQRDARSFRVLAGWPMDLKLGGRMLAKTPGLTAIAVIALAVAIGAGAAYLEFVNDLIHPSLAAPHGSRIVGVSIWDAEQHKGRPIQLAEFDRWRGAVRSFEDLGAFRKLAGHLVTADGRAEPARGVEISPVVFRLFPTTPLLGRGLREDDARAEAAPVAVLGQELWRTRFNSDPTIVGKIIQLGRSGYTVAGVMPESFGFPLNQNLWAPLKVQGHTVPGAADGIQVFGLVRGDVSLSAAGAELAASLPHTDRPMRVEVRSYVDHRRAAETDSVTIERLLYSGNLLFVLLLAICGANVATLVFARTATREAEITVRTALGASRRRICAQLFAEGLILSLVATLVGLLLAGAMGPWLTRLATDAVGQPLPFWWSDTLEFETVLYALGLAIFSAVIIGVVPALKATGPNLQVRMREGAVGGSSMKFGRLWTGVIVTQVAITVIFLAALVSLGWSTYRGRHDQDVTFPRDHFVTARLVLEREVTGAKDPPGREPFYRAGVGALSDALHGVPGVRTVTYATEMPGTTFGRFGLEFAAPEVAAGAVAHSDGLWVRSAGVGANYFESTGASLVAGRLFSESEIDGNRPVAVVDETFVRLVLGGRSAVGLMVREPQGSAKAAGDWHEIIGVVQDVTINPRKKSFDATLFRPVSVDAVAPMHLVVRTHPAAAPLAQKLLTAARPAAPALRITDVKSLDRVAEENALGERVLVRVVGVVAVIALVLSMAGIYAMVSFTLARRTREIGIRVALGAAPRRIITGTFSRAFMQVGLGVAIGGLPSAALLIVGAEDSGGMSGPGLAVMLAVTLFVVGVALLSCAVPLRRALRIEPMQALRAD